MSFQFTASAPNFLGFNIVWNGSSRVPATLVAWIYPDTLPASAGVVKIATDGSADTNGLQNVNNTATIVSVHQGVMAANVTAPGTLSTGVWAHVLGLFTSTASRNVALNGALGTVETTSVGGGNADLFLIGHSTSGGAFNGRLAGIAGWEAALNSSELNSLAKGFSPRRIRPQSLAAYVPMIRDLREIKRNLPNYASWAANNPTVVHPHPRQYGF